MSGGVPAVALTVAGSDPGGGAGVQGDLKTFAAHGVHGLSVITAVTAQNTREVVETYTVPPSVVEAQLRALAADFRVDAVKTGMLADAATVKIVSRCLDLWPGALLVVDPVLRSSSGAALLRDEAIDVLLHELFPRAALVTPNREEALLLAGEGISTPEDAARRLVGRGAAAALITGGDEPGPEVVDRLWDGATMRELRHPRVETTSTHGTGCALSAAVAARLARGEELVPAILSAREWLRGALEAACPLGGGRGPIHHFYRSGRV